MPLRFDEFVALVKAGYTKEDIDKMEAAEDAYKAGQQAEQPKAEQPKAEDKQEEVKQPEKKADIPEQSADLKGLTEEVAALKKAIQAMNRQSAYRADDPDVQCI